MTLPLSICRILNLLRRVWEADHPLSNDRLSVAWLEDQRRHALRVEFHGVAWKWSELIAQMKRREWAAKHQQKKNKKVSRMDRRCASEHLPYRVNGRV